MRISDWSSDVCSSDHNVNIGNRAGKKTEVTLQQLQHIYHELTGATEEISKKYDIGFKIETEELDQLHYRIKQALEQYNVKAKNESVTVFFIDDTKQTFTTFDHFKMMNRASTSIVERVLIQYSFRSEKRR